MFIQENPMKFNLVETVLPTYAFIEGHGLGKVSYYLISPMTGKSEGCIAQSVFGNCITALGDAVIAYTSSSPIYPNSIDAEFVCDVVAYEQEEGTMTIDEIQNNFEFWGLSNVYAIFDIRKHLDLFDFFKRLKKMKVLPSIKNKHKGYAELMGIEE